MARSKSLTATVVPVRLASEKMSSAVRYLNLTPKEGTGPAAGPATVQADSAESASAALGVRRAAPVVAEKPLQEQLYEALRLSEEDFGAKFFIGTPLQYMSGKCADTFTQVLNRAFPGGLMSVTEAATQMDAACKAAS